MPRRASSFVFGMLTMLRRVGAQAEFFSIRSGSKSEYVLTCKKTGSKSTPYKCTHGAGQVMPALYCPMPTACEAIRTSVASQHCYAAQEHGRT